MRGRSVTTADRRSSEEGVAELRDRPASGGAAGAPAAGTSAVPPRLEVVDVTKRYDADPERPAAVNEVSLTVGVGEFVSLVGPSGCGKTTLLKMCAGLVPVSSGTINSNGSPGPAVRGTYGMVFQTPTLLPWWTVLDNVTLPARVLGLDRKKLEVRARELLELVELPGVADRYPNELSGGMQQRASLARSLVHDPDMIFMDEPFGALDAITRDSMNALLQQVQRELNQTILFVTHSIQEAVWLSDRVLVMSSGPGRVIDDVRVDFERPRKQALVADEGFRSLELRLKEELNRSIAAGQAKKHQEVRS